MFKIRKMRVDDVEIVAGMVALDYNSDSEKGYKEAREHISDHLRIIPQHCYIVESPDKQIVAVMVLHPQDKIFEIEDFHVKKIQQNKEALTLLKTKLLEYLENVRSEVLCCPYAMKRLVETG